MAAKKTHEEIEQELQQWIQLNVIVQTMDAAEEHLTTLFESVREAIEHIEIQRKSVSPELIQGTLKSIQDLKNSVQKLELKTAAAQSLYNTIARRVSKLPSESRTVLELRYRYGYTEMEVCQRMKMSYRRVRQLHKEGFALLSTMD